MTSRHLKIALATVTPALVTGGVALAAASGGGGAGTANGAVHHGAGPFAGIGRVARAHFENADVRVFVNGQQRDIRIDRGTVQSASSSSITLSELDGKTVTVPLDASTKVRSMGRPATIGDVKEGEIAFTVRQAGAPARIVRAFQAPRIARAP
jgi:hypothetical protein